MTMLRRLAVLLFLAMALATTASAKPVSQASFVAIGGIPQWITLKSDDDANPVLLILHGGPGDAASPYADSLYAGWEKDFTLVQWDQRGAGRTYGKNGPSIAATMTMARMTADGIEVAEYLKQHLHKSKIILMGGSWGSILGVMMAHARPDLFYAYLGQAQVVNWQQNLSASYARVLQMAEAAKDDANVKALKAIGPPPWKTFLPQWPTYKKAELLYQAKITTAPSPPMAISPEYAGGGGTQAVCRGGGFFGFPFLDRA
jgi:pimeloyl-ACP methyl ester carboxylesterase